MNTINWFEIPVSDFNRAKKFYSRIFANQLISQSVQGHLMAFFPTGNENGISGAIVYGKGYKPSEKGPIIYLNANPDLSVLLKRVKKAGGKILLNKSMISPHIGYYALIKDTEGNKIGLHSKN